MSEIKGKTVFIEAHSRVSVKIKETFYTFEFVERREVPEDADLPMEREALWSDVHGEVDKQVEDIVQAVQILS